METIQTLNTTIDYLRDLEKTLSNSNATINEQAEILIKKVPVLIKELGKLIEYLENDTFTKTKAHSFNNYAYWLDKAIEIISMILDITS